VMLEGVLWYGCKIIDIPCVDLRSRIPSLCNRARDSSGDEQGTRQDGDDLYILDCESRSNKHKNSQWKALCRKI
jgi:hypothetical protein